MRVKLEAGAEFDFVTQDELRKTLAEYATAWRVEHAKGPRPRRFSAMGTVAGGLVRIGGDERAGDGGPLGPDAGFAWSVQRLTVRGLNPAAESLSIYYGTDNPLSLVMDGFSTIVAFAANDLILQGPESLFFGGTALVSAGPIIVTGTAMEVPIGLMYKLV